MEGKKLVIGTSAMVSILESTVVPVRAQKKYYQPSERVIEQLTRIEMNRVRNSYGWSGG